MRQELNKKIKNAKSLEQNKKVQARKVKELEDKKSETKKLVIYSLILNVLTRMPEMIFQISVDIVPLVYIDGRVELVNDAYDLTQFFYHFSYVFNIFFYYSFNRQFKEATQYLLNLKKDKK